MENHSLVAMITQDLAQGTMAKRDAIIRKAIDFKMGRIDWAPEELKGRGELVKYPDGQVVFNFDSAALLAFYPMSVHCDGSGTSTHMVASQNYRVICPELEVYLA